MGNHELEASPQLSARIGGVLYLIIIVAGLFGELFVKDKLIVWRDPAATAANIGSSELLWRAGIAAELLMLICAVALALIFYKLLRPVSRDLALMAAFFNLVSISVEATSRLNLLAALFPLRSADYLQAFEPEQLHVLAYHSIRSDATGFSIGLIFFGCMCLTLGYLIFRSGYLPKIIGVLMQIAGLAYVINGFALVLAPSFASRMVPAILVPAFIGEASLCLWLIVKGVDVDRWKQRAIARP
jgi:hypothetical protein